jgi:vacuolar protein sorting-associated protein 41
MRTLALEPDFARKSTRAFVCGGTAGNLVMHEKGWLGHKETVLHSGEGPIYAVRWRSRLIAWANDLGVKIYDVESGTRITFIDRPPGSPRADLFKCSLLWQDDATLLIGWADHIKVARVRSRAKPAPNLPPLVVEITAVFQMDCMIAGLAPHPTLNAPLAAAAAPASTATAVPTPALTSLLVLAYTPPENFTNTEDELPSDTTRQKRQAAPPPELRLVTRGGEELSSDVLPISGYTAYGCNDYALCAADDEAADAPVAGGPGGRCYVVLSPRDLVVVRGRDRRDHVKWLVDRDRFEEALEEVERMKDEERGEDVDVVQIGQRYIEHLVSEGDFVKAAHLCPKVCGGDAKRWEDWIYVFASSQQLRVRSFPLLMSSNILSGQR